jgi:hypothetical protein
LHDTAGLLRARACNSVCASAASFVVAKRNWDSRGKNGSPGYATTTYGRRCELSCRRLYFRRPDTPHCTKIALQHGRNTSPILRIPLPNLNNLVAVDRPYRELLSGHQLTAVAVVKKNNRKRDTQEVDNGDSR